MNLLQLEYFQVVAKEQSITKAARTLNISQSALSIMMNKLETEIGYPLFQRQGTDTLKQFFKVVRLELSQLNQNTFCRRQAEISHVCSC